MMLHTFVLLFAATYGSGNYNTNNYNGTDAGVLSNTGVYVAGFITLAAVLLLAALIVRIWRRPGKKTTEEPVETEQ